MREYWLEPKYVNQKSFYKKAKVKEDDQGNKMLESYGFPIMYWKNVEPKGFLLVPSTDKWSSRTSMNHIHEFMSQVIGYELFVKAEDIRNNYSRYEAKDSQEVEKVEEKFELTSEQRAELLREMTDLLKEYDYDPQEEAMNKIIDTWLENKNDVLLAISKHPNYNGKFQIAFDSDYNRPFDEEEAVRFKEYILNVYRENAEEYKIGCFTCSEIKSIRDRLSDRVYYLDNYARYEKHNHIIDKVLDEEVAEKIKFEKLWDAALDANIKDIGLWGKPKYVSGDVYDKYQCIARAMERIIYDSSAFITNEDTCDFIKTNFPELRFNNGMKASKFVNKICTTYGINKDPEYNRRFAQFADAINPLAIKRHTVISAHPVDYYTMSFGNTWASCHTIDKTNKRGMDNDYSGCCSGGTESYMLDESSLVMYTVDGDYDGNELELQPKIYRNMIHVGENKFIQARVYPQSNDGALDLYKQFREIAQKVLSDCWNIPNFWTNVKGTNECGKNADTDGVHYRDYLSFEDCNVSYKKTEGSEERSHKLIKIGHDPICPCCGYEHRWEKAIECEDCYTDAHSCYNCGDRMNRDDMHEIDGHWYCEDCCFYCEYHERWEVGDYTYIDNYGRVCGDALDDSETFAPCRNCGEWHWVDDMITAEDGAHFCCDRCVERAGYEYDRRGDLYPEDEIHYCEHCGDLYHDDEWDSEHDCCKDCVSEVENEEVA